MGICREIPAQTLLHLQITMSFLGGLFLVFFSFLSSFSAIFILFPSVNVSLRQTSLSAEEKDAIHPIEGDHIPAVQGSAELSGCLADPHVH